MTRNRFERKNDCKKEEVLTESFSKFAFFSSPDRSSAPSLPTTIISSALRQTRLLNNAFEWLTKQNTTSQRPTTEPLAPPRSWPFILKYLYYSIRNRESDSTHRSRSRRERLGSFPATDAYPRMEWRWRLWTSNWTENLHNHVLHRIYSLCTAGSKAIRNWEAIISSTSEGQNKTSFWKRPRKIGRECFTLHCITWALVQSFDVPKLNDRDRLKECWQCSPIWEQCPWSETVSCLAVQKMTNGRGSHEAEEVYCCSR